MSRTIFRSGVLLAGLLLAGLLLAGAPAFAGSNAAGTGSTTGPAAGNNVKPNTAMHKHGSNGTAERPSIGAGAAGVAAKPNTESGPATKTPDNGQKQ